MSRRLIEDDFSGKKRNEIRRRGYHNVVDSQKKTQMIPDSVVFSESGTTFEAAVKPDRKLEKRALRKDW